MSEPTPEEIAVETLAAQYSVKVSFFVKNGALVWSWRMPASVAREHGTRRYKGVAMSKHGALRDALVQLKIIERKWKWK